MYHEDPLKRFVLNPISGEDNVKTRLPIEALMNVCKYKKQRDLFLQAFANIQRRNYNDVRSYFKVAGIHGLPYDSYNDDGVSKIQGGYCRHSDILFPTWHRLYVMLLERLIYDEAKEIVNSYHDGDIKDEYKEAVENVRFPYWDWASSSVLCQGIPSILFDKFVCVMVPNESGDEEIETKIRNPLRAYTLPVNLGIAELVGDTSNPTQRPYIPDGDIEPYTPAGYSTVRHPNQNYTSDSNFTSLEIVTSCSSTFRPSIYDILSIEDWYSFSNTGMTTKIEPPCDPDGKPKYSCESSIEGVHNVAHDKIGGIGGHMSYPDIASYDPIFFLHHANVDRLFAIWQACHPGDDSWIKEWSDDKKTLNQDTKLEPFLKNDNDYWTSAEVRHIEKLGYNYPELKEPITDPKGFLEAMQKVYHHVVNSNRKWKLNIKVKKNEVGAPFQIRAFIDLPTNNPSTSITSPNFAGFMSIFSRGKTSCASCNDNRKVLVKDDIDLTVCMQRLHLVNERNVMEWDSYSDENPPLTERVTLVTVLKDGSEINLKKVGIMSADIWEIDGNIPKYLGSIYPPSKKA
ncbi:15883_t:CDS:2 [Entrophospora sp. SA101]|nr:12081_t:CDS:2 [Entrophospora sp. SA101]CAJ0635095.1 15883_t:CDS:2 [Entrophospora sp. SA101]CAJ0837020.1 4239_t:CDS:2 [Entrophospora sp. SA101]CAJ0840306.1 13633_t:CDS:2 [Entrophospora sp. SA101]CAJ0858153.1 3516_t:CDS:2 [Entrophospora sp. SA101]